MTAGWCTWHRGEAPDVALIEVIEQGSGPGGGVYACLPCAGRLSIRTLTRDARRAVAELEHRADRRGGETDERL